MQRKSPYTLSDERGSAGGYLALFLCVMLITIGVLAAFQTDIENSLISAANWVGLGWLVAWF